MRVITIGIDPHKSSPTAVAIDAAGHKVGQRRFVVNAGTFGQLIRWCELWPEQRFAVEGVGGLGRTLAQQLAAAGEDVVDVPSTLSARARLLSTGGDRKTDPADALHVAQVALFRTDLRKVVAEDQSTILRLLTERRHDLVNERTRTVNRLHALLRDLLPGGAPTRLSPRAARGARSKARVEARHPAGARPSRMRAPGARAACSKASAAAWTRSRTRAGECAAATARRPPRAATSPAPSSCPARPRSTDASRIRCSASAQSALVTSGVKRSRTRGRDRS
ncbi:transposase [Streptomyces sp. NPDC093093]|uniref:IS110 family transposase n=1 Tax=Streptomyces sp. NPDC093093 TaxID=3366025 RepID=UPI00380F93A5